MKKIEAPCPACGAPVEFKVSSSLVTVCQYCHSLVARGDRQLEDLGKVAALVDTDSPLELGQSGVYRGKSFEIVGHVQYRHAAGGVWDEWYAAFPGNRWGWIAEAQGRIYITFRVKKSQQIDLPERDMLLVGATLDVGEFGTLTVQEIGTATLLAAAGELPYQPEPGKPHTFADLSGEQKRFGTIDLNDTPPVLFLGSQVSLGELGIAQPRAVDREAKEISGQMLACPQCGGGLDLRAPDQSERVTCPFCDALLDVDHGNLKYLKTLEKRKIEPLVPLGATGTLRGRELIVIGFLQRSVNYAGRDYFWTEYLLYHATEGFFWLVNSDGHWSFVEPLAPGEVRVSAKEVVYAGARFQLFQRAMASVRYVLGEFYWKVEVGEVVEAADFVAPPRMISVESTNILQKSQEINVSLGTYLPHEELQQAFHLKPLTVGWSIAPNQPNPVDNTVYWWWVGVAGMLVLINMVFGWIRSAAGVDQSFFWMAEVLVALYPLGVFLYSRDFEKRRWAESDYSPYATDEE